MYAICGVNAAEIGKWVERVKVISHVMSHLRCYWFLLHIEKYIDSIQ